MGPRQSRQPDSINIFLQSSFSDLLGSLVKPRIDDLEPVVTQRSSNCLGASVMPIKSRLGNDNSVWPLHKEETLRPEGP